MHDDNSADPVLDEVSAAFIQQHVSINITATDSANRVALCRACGCRVSSDRRQVTVYVYRDSAREVLKNIRQHGALAAVFSKPSTHETLQLKAGHGILVDCGEEDAACVEHGSATFGEELVAIGFSRDFADAMIGWQSGGIVGVRFTPNAAFIATPGPKAGEKLHP